MLHRFTWDFLCSCLQKDIQDSFPRYPGGLERRLAFGPLEPSASYSAWPRRAPPPRRAPRGPEPPVVCSGFGLDRLRIRLFVLPKRRSGQFSRFAGGQEGGLSLGRIDLTASRPTQPRPASPPRRAPPRPDRPVVCSGFGFERSCPMTCHLVGRDDGIPEHASHEKGV